MKSYSEKLKHPKWQRKRLKAMDKANWMCQECYDDETTLHVHHLKYHNNPWDTPYKYLRVLCEDCHEFLHFFEKEVKEAISKDNFSPYTLDNQGEKFRFIWNIFSNVFQGNDPSIRDKTETSKFINSLFEFISLEVGDG